MVLAEDFVLDLRGKCGTNKYTAGMLRRMTADDDTKKRLNQKLEFEKKIIKRARVTKICLSEKKKC